MEVILIRVLFILYFLLPVCLIAQNSDLLRSSIGMLQENKLDKSKSLIDSLFKDKEQHSIATNWYYKGIIYKAIFKDNSSIDSVRGESRKVALDAFYRYLQLDTLKNNQMVESVNKNVAFINSTYYNDAVSYLDVGEDLKSIENYNNYKKTIRKFSIDTDTLEADINFNLVLGQLYSKRYKQNRADSIYYSKTVNSYTYVLSIDSLNNSANYNLGIFYYNEAVDIIKHLDYDLDLITLELIQDECVALFRKSLPFMLKSYEINPKKKETLIGLSGIYFSLNDEESSDRYRRELEVINNQ